MTDKARIVMLLRYLSENSCNGRFITRAEISEYYERAGFSGSPSTVRSDLLALKEAGIALIEQRENCRQGGIRYAYGIRRRNIDRRSIETVIDMMIRVGRLQEAERTAVVAQLSSEGAGR